LLGTCALKAGIVEIKKGKKNVMLGMTFESFVTLLVIGAAVGVVFHWILRYRYWNRLDAFMGEVMVGWLGAWLGSPVLGHWLWKIGDIYVVPAILGAIVAIHLDVLCWKALSHVWSRGPSAHAQEATRPTKVAA
jgi:uncharacterized membrane protein YeaQ/YmgE (transglycosylase-associated protein family)